MSARSMMERLRWRVQAENDLELAELTGLSFHMLRRYLAGDMDRCTWRPSITLPELLIISTASETPIGMLAEWWAEPEEVGLKEAAKSAALSYN